MAKICGILKTKSKDTSNLIKDMTLLMKHESWHKEFNFSKKNISFGIVSLNQINSEQPIWNKDKTKCIIMSGKIFDYDFKNVKNDAEYILSSYEKFGKEFIKKLNGIFAFALFDFKEESIVLVNDRYGFRPLYYHIDFDKIIFASEVKSIIADKTIKKEIDWKAWGDFFYFGEIHGNNTFFKNISALPPASILTFKNSKVSIEKYYDFSFIKSDDSKKANYFVDKSIELLNRSLDKQTKWLKEADLLLTGGFDSRCIAMIIKNQNRIKLNTFTTLKEGDGDKDKIYAKKVADFLGFKNTFVPLSKDLYQKHFLKTFYLTDGMTNGHLFLMPLIEKLDKKHINFDGIVGDILLRGSFTDEYKLKIGSKKLINTLLNKNKSKIVKKVFNSDVAKIINNSILEETKKELNNFKDTNNFLTLYLLMNEGRRKVALNSMNTLLLKKESFAPFLDNDFVEFALTIPTKLKNKEAIYNKIMNKLNSECMKISSTRGLVENKNLIFYLKRLTFIRNIRSRLYFFLSSSSLFMKFLTKIGLYKRDSKDNLNFEEKLLKKCTERDFINDFKHNSDLYSKYRLQFLLWYNLFFKGKVL